MTPKSVPPALPGWSKREDVPTPPPRSQLRALEPAGEWSLGEGAGVPATGPSLAFLPPVYDEASGPRYLPASSAAAGVPLLPVAHDAPEPSAALPCAQTGADEWHPLSDWRFEVEAARQRAQEAEEHGLWNVNAVVGPPGSRTPSDDRIDTAPPLGFVHDEQEEDEASSAWVASARQTPLRVYESGAHRVRRHPRELDLGAPKVRWLWAAGIALAAAAAATLLHDRTSPSVARAHEESPPRVAADDDTVTERAGVEVPTEATEVLPDVGLAKGAPDGRDDPTDDHSGSDAMAMAATEATTTPLATAPAAQGIVQAPAANEPVPGDVAPGRPLAEWGRLTLPLAEGRVVRTFTLQHPPRVVVDLEGAQIEGPREEPIGEKGIARMRIGRPDPMHVRVVVELDGERKPTQPSAWKRSDSLAIAWR